MRVRSIDGLRGIACLAVVCFHFFYETFKNSLSFYKSNTICFLFDGRLAVSIFFIISGYALSVSFIRHRNIESIARSAIKRWPRLSIPVLSSAIIIYLLSHTGLIFNQNAARILNSDWLAEFLRYKPINLDYIVKFSFIDVYKKHVSHSLNPFLWTMHYEMIGSVLLFFMFFLMYMGLSFLSIPIALVAISLLIKKSFLVLICFIIGYILCFIKNKSPEFVNFKKTEILFFITLFFMSIFFKGLYYSELFIPIKAAAICFVALSSQQISELLESNPVQYLGKISFPLFIFQFPVLVSFSSYLMVNYYTHPSLPLSLVIAISGVLMSLIVASILSPVELITQKICNLFYEKIINIFSNIKKIIA